MNLESFGADRGHMVDLEKVLPAKPGVKYPVCVAGARRCPPDDCGGPCGFQDLLRALKDPDDEENEELMEWVGDAYDPKDFKAASVRFTDPRTRRNVITR